MYQGLFPSPWGRKPELLDASFPIMEKSTEKITFVVRPMFVALVHLCISRRFPACRRNAATKKDVEEILVKLLKIVRSKRYPFELDVRRQRPYSRDQFFRDAMVKHMQLILRKELTDGERANSQAATD